MIGSKIRRCQPGRFGEVRQQTRSAATRPPPTRRWTPQAGAANQGLGKVTGCPLRDHQADSVR